MTHKILLFSFAALLVFLSSGLVTAQECTTMNYTACHEGNIWWFNSCGSPEFVSSYCGWNQVCREGRCEIKCGNGVCESDENCFSCSNDCKCSSYEQCVNGHCQTYCGNGRCDSGENCLNCYECSCSSSEECMPGNTRADSRGCASLCGNKKKDYGEDCSSCPADAGCGQGLYCYNGQCVDCYEDSHCETRQTPTGEFTCSSDFRSTLEKVKVKAGVCRNHLCTGEEEETTRKGMDCGDKLCQNSHCGCEEGYKACLKTGRCEKTEVIEDGSNCGCYFQCKSNYCNKEGRCLSAINAILSSEKSMMTVGETTLVTISADNALDADVKAKLTLNIDTGASMSGVIGGADCTGNQCTGGEITIPAKHRKAVSVTIQGQSANVVTITAVIMPIIEGESYPMTRQTAVTVIHPGDGKCTDGETTINACTDCGCPSDTIFYSYTCEQADNSCEKSVGWWVYVTVLSTLVLAALIVFGVAKGKSIYASMTLEREKRAMEKEKAEKAAKAGEEKDRQAVRKAIYKMRSKISLDNPPDLNAIISKLDMDVDEKIIDEEYTSMLEHMKQAKKATEKGAPVQASAVKYPKFCTKCGNRMNVGAKFCTKCGAVIKPIG